MMGNEETTLNLFTIFQQVEKHTQFDRLFERHTEKRWHRLQQVNTSCNQTADVIHIKRNLYVFT